MARRRPSIVALAALGASLLVVVGALAQPSPKITWEDAPPIARKMTLGEAEFRGLFREAERRYVTYAPPGVTHCGSYDRPDGRPRIDGRWDKKTKEGKTDTEYRTTDSNNNPFGAVVCTRLRFAPPSKDANKAEGATLIIHGTVNGLAQTLEMRRQRLATIKQEEAKRYQQSRASGFKNTYVADLGWKLDHQSLYASADGNRVSQVTVEMVRLRDGLMVKVDLLNGGGVLKGDRAIALARGAAAILARKVYGANVPRQEGEEEEGEVGIIEAYIVTQLGQVPQMDRREDRIPIGKPFYLAVVLKPTRPDKEWRLLISLTPTPQAIEASRKRLAGSGERPLRADTVMQRSGTRLASNALVTNDEPWIRRTWVPGTEVVYQPFDTENRRLLFWKGPGRWEIELAMRENNGGNFLEVSTTKVGVTVFDPQPREEGKPPAPPAGRAGQNVGGWKD